MSFHPEVNRPVPNSHVTVCPLAPSVYVYTVSSAAVSRFWVATITIGTASTAASIRSPCMKSVQQTALNPPRKVQASIASAKTIMAVLVLRLGNTVVNTDAPATNPEATYTVKQTKNITAQIICRVLLFAINLLLRY